MKKLLLIFLILMSTGCTTTRYVDRVHTEYRHTTDTLMQHDSVLKWDSVVIRVKGDTVYNDRWHTVYKSNIIYKVKTDTLCKIDSIDRPVYIEKKQTFIQKVNNVIGSVIIATIILLVLYFVFRIIKKKI